MRAVWTTIVILLAYHQGAVGDWVFEVQLHNYTNPYNAYYHRPDQTFYCCEPCPLGEGTFSSPVLDTINCTCRDGMVRYCDLSLTICGADDSPDEECYDTVPITGTDVSFSFVSEGSVGNTDRYEVFRFDGSTVTSKGNIDLRIVAYEYDLRMSLIVDEFDLPLPFQIMPYFPEPVTYEGTNNIASLTLSYRMYCIEDYYGSFCQVYCRPINDSGGHYSCDCQGQKVCLEGYINPQDNCRERNVSVSTTTIDTATIAMATVTMATVATPTPTATSGNTSSSEQVWMSATFTLAILLALCIGIIGAVCFIYIARQCKKRRAKAYLRDPAFHNPSYRNTLPSQQGGVIINSDIDDVNNELYDGPTTQSDYREEWLNKRPKAPLPSVRQEEREKYSYEDITVHDNDSKIEKELYDKVCHH